MMKYLKLVLVLIIIMALTTGCLPGDKDFEDDSAGFFWGILHGWLAPFSLLISLFNDKVTMYEIHNTGFGYNFGFYIAIIGGFGGISFTRKKRKKDK